MKFCWTLSVSASMSAGAMSDTTHGGVSFYIILVGVLALVTVCGCTACAFILSHLHRKRKKQQAVPQEEGINNQREFVNLIRNVDRPVPLLPPAVAPLAPPPAPAPVSRCYEEIELTLPPSPAPSHPSPALKPAHAPKLDISNREREKLNRFHYTDGQELEAWPLNSWELLIFYFILRFSHSLAHRPDSSFLHCVSIAVLKTGWPHDLYVLKSLSADTWGGAKAAISRRVKV